MQRHNRKEVRSCVQADITVGNVWVQLAYLLPVCGSKAVEYLRCGLIQRLVEQHEIIPAKTLIHLTEIVVDVSLCCQPLSNFPSHIYENYSVVISADDIGENRVPMYKLRPLRFLVGLEVLHEINDALGHLSCVDADLHAQGVVQLLVFLCAFSDLVGIVRAQLLRGCARLQRTRRANFCRLSVYSMQGAHQLAHPHLHEQPRCCQMRESDACDFGHGDRRHLIRSLVAINDLERLGEKVLKTRGDGTIPMVFSTQDVSGGRLDDARRSSGPDQVKGTRIYRPFDRSKLVCLV
mmetsp:Transcript_110796/g.300680  ORF Transcript_110796/g.300680 Transcript_110796/m.300680 type:complete len:293 (-) Transcript_110796:1021-1899(-)